MFKVVYSRCVQCGKGLIASLICLFIYIAVIQVARNDLFKSNYTLSQDTSIYLITLKNKFELNAWTNIKYTRAFEIKLTELS